MTDKMGTHSKVVVVGAGSVGTTYIYALLQKGMAEEIVLVDVDQSRVEGEVMDLSHGLPYVPPAVVRGGDYDECADAGLIVVTAGASQSPGQSRTDLVRQNAEIIKNISLKIAETGSEAVLVMVTNPVDTLTLVAQKHLGWPKHRVIGSGTVLDSARFRYLIGRRCGIDVHNIHAYVLGEHGDSEFAAWSLTHVAGVAIEEYCRLCSHCNGDENPLIDIFEQVRNSAYHIIDYKGSTFFGIGMSLLRISGAILRNEQSILTVSSQVGGHYGLPDVCLSLPAVVGKEGVKRLVNPELPPEELDALKYSAGMICDTYESVST